MVNTETIERQNKKMQKVIKLHGKLEETISKLKIRIDKKDSIIKKFKSKRIYLELDEKNEELKLKNIELRKTIVKKQEIGCYECNSEKRLIAFSNISICIECISLAEKNHWTG